ncbi:hypothetical protein EDEG_01425 [Edhazardia aedis USNM 41457]|uniref:Uncharacterized protein n=1 Tax=Edhazardia aedis (strain USNM 41457) TaxID=1003232 RepID=J9D949_EDHAE|nr:hypothetical protein EDEG_01425 [Edhazardia aedis USNM 41457]|eukprot:EJW04301.1 hypothetical protein EDEG_01425 [Edhazardia aedis USNM 41457]
MKDKKLFNGNVEKNVYNKCDDEEKNGDKYVSDNKESKKLGLKDLCSFQANELVRSDLVKKMLSDVKYINDKIGTDKMLYNSKHRCKGQDDNSILSKEKANKCDSNEKSSNFKRKKIKLEAEKKILQDVVKINNKNFIGDEKQFCKAKLSCKEAISQLINKFDGERNKKTVKIDQESHMIQGEKNNEEVSVKSVKRDLKNKEYSDSDAYSALKNIIESFGSQINKQTNGNEEFEDMTRENENIDCSVKQHQDYQETKKTDNRTDNKYIVKDDNAVQAKYETEKIIAEDSKNKYTEDNLEFNKKKLIC